MKKRKLTVNPLLAVRAITQTMIYVRLYKSFTGLELYSVYHKCTFPISTMAVPSNENKSKARLRKDESLYFHKDLTIEKITVLHIIS